MHKVTAARTARYCAGMETWWRPSVWLGHDAHSPPPPTPTPDELCGRGNACLKLPKGLEDLCCCPV